MPACPNPLQQRRLFAVVHLQRHSLLQVIRAAAVLVPELAEAQTQQVTAGLMPYPVDAHPMVGFTKAWPNLYVAVMHSGATLAPLMGKLVSEETANKQEQDLLAPYRLQRDFADLSHTY